MKLHKDKNLFQQAVRFTADQMGIPAVYVEKDYWVTFALYRIFTNEIGKDVVFKEQIDCQVGCSIIWNSGLCRTL